MKKWIICLAAVIALSMLSACAGQKPAESQLPNPIEEYETLEDAQAAAGFEIPTPAGLPEGYALEAVTTIAKNTIQLIYTDGQNDLTYRCGKADGSDISGDYNAYDEEETADVNGNAVLMKGADGSRSLAVWQDDAFSYSLHAASPLSKEQLVKIVESFKN